VAEEFEIEAIKEGDIESLKNTLVEAKAEAENYLNNWQRAEADLTNYKKQAEQEREELTKFANKSLIQSLLPILDDFELALKSLPDQSIESSWVEGISLIYHKLKAALESQGLSEIKALGEDFDPKIHEAVIMVEGGEGKVVEELQKGYQFHQRLVRPALVAVGKGKGE
jgi:molecular chaperone GrpE